MRSKIIALAVVAVASVGSIHAQEKKLPATESDKQTKEVPETKQVPETRSAKENVKPAQATEKPTRDPAVIRERDVQRVSRQTAANERLVQDLELNEEQSAQLDEIEAEYSATMQEIRMSSDRENMQEKSRLARDKREQRLKEILTPEQYQKMVSMQTQRRENTIKRDGEMQKQRRAN